MSYDAWLTSNNPIDRDRDFFFFCDECEDEIMVGYIMDEYGGDLFMCEECAINVLRENFNSHPEEWTVITENGFTDFDEWADSLDKHVLEWLEIPTIRAIDHCEKFECEPYTRGGVWR